MLCHFTTKMLLNDIIFIANPLLTPPWTGVSSIAIDEISQLLDQQKLLAPKEAYRGHGASRIEHLQRIAWLIKHIDIKPIQFNVGRRWPISDGNHRLAAAIYRKDEYISVHFSGEEEKIQELIQLGHVA